HLQNATIEHLIDSSPKGWNRETVSALFDQQTAEAICKTPLVQQVNTDKLVRKTEKKGNYSVPAKVKNLVLRICRGCFPTRAYLRDKGVQCPPNCVVCDDNYEDTIHILFMCPLSIQLNAQESAHMAAIMWSLWKHRNLELCQNTTETCAQIVERALRLIEDCVQTNNSKLPPQDYATTEAG
ncbi:pentatricopeptide repeat-containing protein, partial [Trifolium medium]|nr:pentatricopeptide repeat-containing protein [Trifolium medium]